MPSNPAPIPPPPLETRKGGIRAGIAEAAGKGGSPTPAPGGGGTIVSPEIERPEELDPPSAALPSSLPSKDVMAETMAATTPTREQAIRTNAVGMANSVVPMNPGETPIERARKLLPVAEVLRAYIETGEVPADERPPVPPGGYV